MRKSRILMTIGVLLISGALSLSIYNRYEDKYAEEKSREIYIKLQDNLVHHENKEPAVEQMNNKTEMDVISIDGYDYIGSIEIPTLSLELPIMNDWSYNKMKMAPCRYYGSVFTNDLVICAHAYDSLFGNLKNLKQGDKLILTDINSNKYIYEVEVIEILTPYDIDEMIESEFDLTLYTCTYDNQNRVTVRLNMIDE